MDLNQYLEFANQLADKGHSILSKAGTMRPQEQVKADKSFVTKLDGEIELQLRALIEQKYPHHGILGEEYGAKNINSEFVWVLDPIDGTAPFIAGVPVYGTLIALCHNAEPVLGIIDMAATNDRWVGVKGQATRHTSGICATRQAESLATCILTASNPDFFTKEELPALEILKSKTAWRIYGGCCMSYGLLASGRTDLAIDTRLSIYDYAPFVPIIEGAGGIITDWQGKALNLHSGKQVLAAGNKELHSKALQEITKALQ